jgi:biopolymer transport protein ExbD
MPDANVKKSTSQFRPTLLQSLALVALLLTALDTDVSAQAQDVQILFSKESVKVGYAELCSEEDLKVTLSEYAIETTIYVENDPSIDTDRVLRLLEIIRDLGYENVTSASAGEPGWTLYPLPDDVDVFRCEEARE